jgi:hypothetical protein
MGLDNRNKRSMLEGSKIMKLMTLVAVLGGCADNISAESERVFVYMNVPFEAKYQ